MKKKNLVEQLYFGIILSIHSVYATKIFGAGWSYFYSCFGEFEEEAKMISNDNIGKINVWFTKNQKLLNSSRNNDQLQRIIRTNIGLKHQLRDENIQNFFQEACSNMNELLDIQFSEVDLLASGKPFGIQSQ